jgi:hypothetical protein
MKLMGDSYLSFYINPTLSDSQRNELLRFICDKLHHVGNNIYKFHDQLDRVHVDEKWFYVDSIKGK